VYRTDGRTFAVGTVTDTTSVASLLVVDATTGDVVERHTLANSPTGTAYYSGGRRLATLGTTTGNLEAQSTPFELWDADGMTPIATIAIASYAPRIAASPDGTRLLVIDTPTNEDAPLTATLWDMRPRSWVRHACEAAGRALTRAEWERYLPNREYDPVCRRSA
jgi:hypothetical protein